MASDNQREQIEGAAHTTAPAPLNGIRVIELGTAITAPFCGMLLGDMGADVIKVERPGGDFFRSGATTGYPPTFAAYNRSKRSVTIDLASEAGKDEFAGLLASADIFVDNFRPGALDRLGFGNDRVRAINPALIHCSLTGFGAIGPYRDRPAFDTIGQAVSGFASLLMDPEAPDIVGPTISDNVTAFYSVYAVLSALVERASTGRGRRIEINMLEATMSVIPDRFLNFACYGIDSDRHARAAHSQCFALACADNEIISVHLSTQESNWRRLLATMEMPELGDDPRFSSHRARVANYAALKEVLQRRFADLDLEEWLSRLIEQDVPVAPVMTISQVLADPQVAALGTMHKVSHPVAGDLPMLHSPVLIDGERPTTAMKAPPLAGEHNAEVFEDLGAIRGED